MGVALVPQDHSERGSVAVWKWALAWWHTPEPALCLFAESFPRGAMGEASGSHGCRV